MSWNGERGRLGQRISSSSCCARRCTCFSCSMRMVAEPPSLILMRVPSRGARFFSGANRGAIKPGAMLGSSSGARMVRFKATRAHFLGRLHHILHRLWRCFELEACRPLWPLASELAVVITVNKFATVDLTRIECKAEKAYFAARSNYVWWRAPREPHTFEDELAASTKNLD
eukprot:6172609-Pleurochrysis_carterae.AAC.2